MNQLKKLTLIRKIRKVQDRIPKGKEILITLDDYFDGNDEENCIILANTDVNVSSKEFESFLRNIKKNDCVFDIFIRFYDYEDAIDFDDIWVNSDTIFIITTASTEEVKVWFEFYTPSSISEEIETKDFANLPSIPNGYKIISIWWD